MSNPNSKQPGAVKYTSNDWLKDKMLIAKLLNAKRYKEAYKSLSDIAMVNEYELTQSYINGMLFVLDVIQEKIN